MACGPWCRGGGCSATNSKERATTPARSSDSSRPPSIWRSSGATLAPHCGSTSSRWARGSGGCSLLNSNRRRGRGAARHGDAESVVARLDTPRAIRRTPRGRSRLHPEPRSPCPLSAGVSFHRSPRSRPAARERRRFPDGHRRTSPRAAPRFRTGSVSTVMGRSSRRNGMSRFGRRWVVVGRATREKGSSTTMGGEANAGPAAPNDGTSTGQRSAPQVEVSGSRTRRRTSREPGGRREGGDDLETVLLETLAELRRIEHRRRLEVIQNRALVVREIADTAEGRSACASPPRRAPLLASGSPPAPPPFRPSLDRAGRYALILMLPPVTPLAMISAASRAERPGSGFFRSGKVYEDRCDTWRPGPFTLIESLRGLPRSADSGAKART